MTISWDPLMFFKQRNKTCKNWSLNRIIFLPCPCQQRFFHCGQTTFYCLISLLLRDEKEKKLSTNGKYGTLSLCHHDKMKQCIFHTYTLTSEKNLGKKILAKRTSDEHDDETRNSPDLPFHLPIHARHGTIACDPFVFGWLDIFT